jgi:hypothetical protein
MLLVTVLCSDPECVEEREIVLVDLDAIDGHACDCGHGFVVVAVSEVDEPKQPGALVSLPERRRQPRRRAA